MENYFNTNNETGETLKKSNDKAKTQEEIILNWFKGMSPKHFTPEHFEIESVPITSIRRAFSNLQKRGFIEKTGKMTMGKYGKMIHTWRLK